MTNKDYRFEGVIVPGKKGFWDIHIKNGKFETISNSSKRIGGILSPRFADIHVHLDKTGTAKRIGERAGTLFDAIELMNMDKELWTQDDIYNRATEAINSAWSNGTRYIRTHVDWIKPETPKAWEVLKDIRNEWKGRIEIQIASLCPIDLLADRIEELAKIIKADNAILGGFIYRNEELSKKLKPVFERAKRSDLELDFHVDEGLDKEANGFDYILDFTEKFGLKRRVLCSHACSLSIRDKSRVETLLKMAADQEVGLTCLPTTNLWLQDNIVDKTPKYRGLAPVIEAHKAGVSVMIASDNCQDAFYPFGNHNLIEAFSTAVLAAQLDERTWFDSITTLPATWMGGDNNIREGEEASFLRFNVNSFDQLLSRSGYNFEIWHKGKIVG